METLVFELRSASAACRAGRPVLCGVVSSGNLEVLVEPCGAKDECRFEVNTTAKGFGEIWEAVFRDFTERQSAGGLCFSINDAGAAPDIVGLRLDQAIDIYKSY